MILSFVNLSKPLNLSDSVISFAKGGVVDNNIAFYAYFTGLL